MSAKVVAERMQRRELTEVSRAGDSRGVLPFARLKRGDVVGEL